MKTLKSKAMAILITALLTFSMTASMILIPNATAHTPAWNIPTESFLNVAPNPIGVGQTLTIDMWLMEPPPTAANQYGDRWMGFKVTVTLPDGTTTALGPYTSDDTGGVAVTYTPAKVGNYTFVMNFPGQTLAGINPAPPYAAGATGAQAKASIGDYFEPSTSNTVTITVQQQSIASIPFNSLPTNYWTRPINAMNINWYSISGNWVGIGGDYNSSTIYNPYTLAPMTSHILWTKPEAFGGVVGGEFGGPNVIGSETSNYYAMRQYETMFTPIILNGILYYEQYPQSTNNPVGWVAVNLKTGQTIWTDNAANNGGGSPQQTALTSTGIVTTLYSGQLLDYVSPNQFGGYAYLWSTGTPAGVISTGVTYNLFDAMTGMYILSIVNGSSMSLTQDAQGNLVGYWVNDANPNAPTLNAWNSTLAITTYWNNPAVGGTNTPWEFRPAQDAKIPFKDGIMWSVPLPSTYKGNSITTLTSTSGTAGFAIGAINSGVIMLYCCPLEGYLYQQGYMIEAGYSQTTGAQLWITNRTETPETRLSGPSSAMDSNGVYVEINMETLVMNGYSDSTGNLVWGPTSLPNANTYDTDQISGFVANGILYVYALGGDVYAINILNGAILWHTTTTAIQGSAGYNTPYGVWPLWSQGTPNVIADGVMWFAEGHSYSPPLPRGLQLLGLNITDGKPVWSIIGDFVDLHLAIADGVLIGANNYDNQIYAFGMGPSKTTVTAPDVGATTATPITITGTVTDISAGSQQEAVAANFPNGLPCVSDASMTQFMEAVYEQQPMPTNITGVPVTISVTDSNNNHYEIGTVTTNSNGFYSLTWTPIITGNYTVTATFAGTQSYYGSSANAAFYASAPAPTNAPTAAPVSGLASTGTVELGVAIIVIVIVICVAAMAMLTLRRRP